MKRLLVVLAVALAASSLPAANSPNSPKEVSFSLLKTAPEKYKGKLITYSEVFRDFANTFPMYIEMAGFKSTRWILLTIGDLKLPVLIKKNDEVTALVADLQPGTTVVVIGRIREFKVDPLIPSYAKYYVDADSIVPVSGAQAQQVNRNPAVPQQPQVKPRMAPNKKAVEPPPF